MACFNSFFNNSDIGENLIFCGGNSTSEFFVQDVVNFVFRYNFWETINWDICSNRMKENDINTEGNTWTLCRWCNAWLLQLYIDSAHTLYYNNATLHTPCSTIMHSCSHPVVQQCTLCTHSVVQQCTLFTHPVVQ